MTSAVKVAGLVKRFGTKVVLRQVAFSLQTGEFAALLGPNGAGKTTIMRILATLSKPTLGEVEIGGVSLRDYSALVRQRLGVVEHLPLLYGDMTAEENLDFYARLYGLANCAERVNEVLSLIGLENRRSDLVRTYSRGMQQRLSIGRAILHDPEVLLLDEPHTGLDQAASDMLDITLREVAAKGRTILMTSHDLARVDELATRFLVLNHGRIVAETGKQSLGDDNVLEFYKQSLSIPAAQRSEKMAAP